MTAAGFFGVSIEGTMGEHYRRAIGKHTARALARRRATGRRHTRVPRYGERYTPGGRVVADAKEQAIIARARRLRAAGKSLRQVSAALAARGMLARSGRPFTTMTLSRVLGRTE